MLLLPFLALTASPADAAGAGVAMYGEPELRSDFTHLPYANPDAPKGGSIRFGEVGGFDSLNPFIVKGTAPWQLRYKVFESLLARNWDEPFSLYPLLAESVEIAPDRSWVEFMLDPAARFSDGSAVTVDDVIYSMELLAKDGRPNYRNTWSNVAGAERVGARGVRFRFVTPEREAPLILALHPILKRADAETRNFRETTLSPLIGSGAYVVDAFEPGRRIIFRRNPDHWARDLPVMRGQANFDEIIIDYFRDANAVWEAFTAGAIDVYRDSDPARWRAGYGFPAAQEGRIVQAEIPNGRPSGMKGFVFNTRKSIFEDIRVREALTLAFDFEWIQRTMLAGAFARIPSYFGGSPLAHSGAAEGREREILAPFADALPEGALDATIEQPVSTGDGRNRRNLRRAAKLLEDAGWRVSDGRLTDADGDAFAFEILLGAGADEQVAGIYAEALKRLGVSASVRLVDAAQYQARRNDYDYDMIVNTWALSLSPGIEQRFYWGEAGVQTPGTRNYMGVGNPAVEAALDALAAADTKAAFISSVRALDRALTAGRYVIPFWYAPKSWIAHDARLARPESVPLYGDWIGYLPDVWWRTE
ncbi:extracellular solute-binding protein [Pikeienuella piscinae]|nr:extracellular solute-binding protein [Pikeienuella piscinae]